MALPNLSALALGEPTGEFYPLPPDEAREPREPLTSAPIPSGAQREHANATFRLPFPESASKNADGSYKYRVYDALALWDWVREPRRAIDPMNRTPLLKSDWEALRDRYSSAAADPTPGNVRWRRPITSGLWPPGVPYVPPPPPPPPPLSNHAIRVAVDYVLQVGGPDYVHPDYGPIAEWDVSNVTNMSGIFSNARAFNGDLSNWKVGNVKTMDHMFAGARNFKGDLSKWNVGNVTTMKNMFSNAMKFKGDLSLWDVRNVTDMSGMFSNARAFNGDLSNWKVGNVKTMDYMFWDARKFNGDLSDWDVRNVTEMGAMFYDAKNFNGDLSRWDVRRVKHRGAMFYGAFSYNPEHALGSRAGSG